MADGFAVRGEPGDAELLRSIAGGEVAAFRLFYDRYGSRVRGYARQLLRGDTPRSEDLAQEVFLTVWRKAATFDQDRGDAAGWLYTIVRNRFLDDRRRAARTPRGADTIDLARVAVEAAGPGTEWKVSLEKALGKLRPEQRQAVELAYFGGLTYEETAVRLRVPVGTLKSRIRVALATLRGVLEFGP